MKKYLYPTPFLFLMLILLLSGCGPAESNATQNPGSAGETAGENDSAPGMGMGNKSAVIWAAAA
jgi:uncharacterized protein YceK